MVYRDRVRVRVGVRGRGRLHGAACWLAGQARV